jgi:prepilin-type N-terminal cleavage/methylation domain-containing protein
MNQFPSTPSFKRHGFTLVELLLAIGIISILAAVTITALNPGKQLGDARNTQRKFDVNTILNAFGQYSIDSNGSFLPGVVDGTSLLSNCATASTNKKLCKAETTHGTGVGQCGHADVSCVWSRHLSGTYISNRG